MVCDVCYGCWGLCSACCSVPYAALYSGGRGGRAPFARGVRVMRRVLEVVLHVLEAEKDIRHMLQVR